MMGADYPPADATREQVTAWERERRAGQQEASPCDCGHARIWHATCFPWRCERWNCNCDAFSAAVKEDA